MSRLKAAEAVGLPYRAQPNGTVDVHDLEEFHERHSRDTWWARAVLVTVICGMLAVNLWMTHRNYEEMMIDIDASRLAASEIDQQTTIRLEALDRRLAAIEARLPAEPVAALDSLPR